MAYSIIAAIIRLFLAVRLWKTGRLALSGNTRTGGRVIELVCAVSLLFGFYVYLFTLILLIHLAIKMWMIRQSGGNWRNRGDLILFALTLIIFLNGPGAFSLDSVLGNL